MVQYYISALINAWELLLDIPVPAGVKRHFQLDEDELAPSSILLCFPILGFCIGVIIYLLFQVLSISVGQPASTVLATILTIFILESVSYGKNLTMAVKLIERFMGMSENAVQDMDSRKLFAFISIYLLRICCVGFIFFYDNPFWFIVTLTLAYSVQGHMAAKKDDDGDAVFEIEDENKGWHLWFVAAALLLVFCIFSKYYFVFMLCAFLLAYFFADKGHGVCLKLAGSISGVLIGVSGYAFETLCLLLGVIFLARH